MSKSTISSQISKLISEGKEVYVFGDKLKQKELINLLGINSKEPNDIKIQRDSLQKNIIDPTYNIIGFANGVINYTCNVISEDSNVGNLKPTVELFLSDILRNKEKSKSKPISYTRRDEKGIVEALDYSSNTTVKSSYNNMSTYYANDASGNPILRASLNTDWILKRNTSNDSDPNYDYFYVRDNTELYTNSSKATNGYGIHVKHSLPYSTSDNVLDWGPDSTSNASSVTATIPWGVEWQFTVGNGLDIATSRSQTTDTVTWDVTNYAFTGLRYNFSGDYNRLQPGTAWASSGTYATINLYNVASFYYGSTYKELTQSFPVTYDYN